MKPFTQALPQAADQALSAEVRAELQSHLEEAKEALIESGVDSGEAEARALAQFGDFETTLRDCVAERTKENDPMKATLIALVVLLTGALMFTVLQSRRAHAQQLTALEMHSFASALEAEQAAKEPRPVIYSVGDVIEVSDLEGNGPHRAISVAVDGMGLFPHLGWVQVHGKQREVLEAELQERYQEIYTTPLRIVVQRL